MASWPRAAAIIRAVTPSIPCYSCISTMVQEELGHSYVATCSSSHQCCATVVVCCPTPWSKRSWAIVTWPPAAASISAVLPSLSTAPAVAPWCKRIWAIASWPPAAAITSSVTCCSCISTMFQQERGHSLMATCSSSHQCCATVVVCFPRISTML